MPIDLARIAAAFEAPFALQLKGISLAFEEVGRRLRARLREASLLESASRDYPTLTFRDDAVTLWIDRVQHRALAPSTPAPSFGASLQRAGSRFSRELGRVRLAVRQERLVPGLFERTAEVLEAIDASIARFERVSPEMFDPRRRKASDLFGEAALLWRALGSSTEHLRGVAGQLAEAQALFTDYFTGRELLQRLEAERTGQAVAHAEEALAAAGTPGPLAESPVAMLEEGTRLLVGTALVLPLIPEWLTLLHGPGGANLRLALLDAFSKHGVAALEETVIGLRRQVLDTVYGDLLKVAQQASDFLWAVERVFLGTLRVFLEFGHLYGEELVTAVVFFVEDLSKYLHAWTVVIEKLRRFVDFIMNADLLPLLATAMGFGGARLLLLIPGMPSLSLRDLLVLDANVRRVATRAGALSALTMAEAELSLVPEFLFKDKKKHLRQLDLMKQVVRAATTAPPPLPPETARFQYPEHVGFPHLGWAFFGWGAPDFRSTLATLRDGVQRTVRENLLVGEDLLENVADVFQRVQTEAMLLGAPERYRAISEQSEQLTATVFGAQAEELQARLAARRPDLLAEAFEGWLAMGGFQLVGQTLPLYVEEMDSWWHAGQEAYPTSPHLLARRARVGRVSMQRLTLDARGRPLDEALALELAHQFQGAVATAYTTASEELRRGGHG
ncbi:hypothetical protein [Myxococcus sp. RHSTA-1-4]|uniref:hypothetical protein n=1 Tax=Myxococcus sp. RHSTA-1-4 TaxID=2874601 RepID=UPI00272E5832|nr:hypothetical protein [Myxococcus sp. RHSTA-1-4]MBZ4417436.1 hypothetical protein [Myxococcus sp. RHSTA-1-4]